MKGGGTIMHSFGGFTRFVSRPCRDAGLSRHCEDFVSCTVLCKVASLSGRWLIDGLLTALRELRPLVPCYARSRPCRDGSPLFIRY